MPDAAFQNTGLERSVSLDDDIAWMEAEYGLKAPVPQPDGPGNTYAQ